MISKDYIRLTESVYFVEVLGFEYLKPQWCGNLLSAVIFYVKEVSRSLLYEFLERGSNFRAFSWT